MPRRKMFQSDYILRMIEQIGQMIRRIIDRLAERRPEEAFELTEEAVGLTLDVDPDTALQLTGEGLLMLMGGGGEPDPKQALLLGEVLALRAQARADMGQPAQAWQEAERARVILLAATSTDIEEDAARAKELVAGLDAMLADRSE
jgi:hypothetical protein